MQRALISSAGRCLISLLLADLFDKIYVSGFLLKSILNLLLLIELNQQVTLVDMASTLSQLSNDETAEARPGKTGSSDGKKVDRLHGAGKAHAPNKVATLD